MSRRVQWRGRHERGSVLVVTLMLVLIMSLIGSGVFNVAMLDDGLALNDARQGQALYLAEAGLSVARREMADGDGTHDFLAIFNAAGPMTLFTNKAFGSGSFTAVARPVTGSIPKRITVTATGCVPAAADNSPCPANYAQTTLQGAIVNPLALAGPFVGLESISIGAQSRIDSFDSDQGSYNATKCPAANPQLGCQASIIAAGTNASSTTTVVSIGKNTVVYGSITASKGVVELLSDANVWGDVTYNAQQGGFSGKTTQVKGALINAPTTPPPAQSMPACGPPFTSAAEVASKMRTKTNQGSVEYDESTGEFQFHGNNGGILLINPGTYCFNMVTVDSSGVIEVPAVQSSPVVIHLTGPLPPKDKVNYALDLTSGTIVNATFQAKNLQFILSYSGDKGVRIAGGPSTYVYVYAPQTSISVSGGADLYGALLGKTLTAEGGILLHYDRALGNSKDLHAGLPTTFYVWNPGSWKACKTPTCT